MNTSREYLCYYGTLSFVLNERQDYKRAIRLLANSSLLCLLIELSFIRGDEVGEIRSTERAIRNPDLLFHANGLGESEAVWECRQLILISHTTSPCNQPHPSKAIL